MALVPFLERQQTPATHPTDHPYDTAQRAVGQVLNFHRTVAHSPRAP